MYGGVFCVTILGGLYLAGLIHGGAYFRNFTVSQLKNANNLTLNKTLTFLI